MTKQLIESVPTSNEHKPSVLISGAGFGGLAAVWWMNRLGYAVSVVEIATGLRKGGTPVDIKEGVIEVVRRMGLLERIISHSLPPRPSEFLNANGEVVAPMPGQASQETIATGANDDAEAEYEVERDVLLDMLFQEVKDDAEFMFGDSILSLAESEEEVAVTLQAATNVLSTWFLVAMGPTRPCEGCASVRNPPSFFFCRTTFHSPSSTSC